LFEPGTNVAGVFTQSAFRAAPVILAEESLKTGRVQGLLINSGNANAATGQLGREQAILLCSTLAEEVGLAVEQVIPFSTGVIGEQLPVAKMIPAISQCVENLAEGNWLEVAKAIMTTDTVPKLVSQKIELDGVVVTVTGIAKGSGMIRPDMATMLSFMACDAVMEESVLDALLHRVCERSFNRVTVDGDTSTNDSLILAATGQAGMEPIEERDDVRLLPLENCILDVALSLAQSMVRDGEGATKFVTVAVSGAKTSEDALKVAYTVAESPLVKTALFAEDANWGRLCMAIGRSGVRGLDAEKINIHFDAVAVVVGGLQATGYSDAAGTEVMTQDEYTIAIELGMGEFKETVWTTDLSHEYIKINAEYRT
jgi:glutamate N-acetyltransferase/amino-acid N-acetyltransferase